MKDLLADLVRNALSPAHGTNRIREYLQARILGSLQRSGAMIPLAFHGGTALRFLYGHTRFSEDLDFALERQDTKYDFRALIQAIRSDLIPEGYSVELKVNDRKAVHSAFVRFPGLLHELGLSPHRDQVISVKIEVDTCPPAGALLATTVVRRHVLLQLQHHDRASFLAGKIHAVLQRAHLKGRDMHDLMWYLGDPDWPEPNLSMLNNALDQTGWSGDTVTENTWRKILRDRLRSVAWDQVVLDVQPFLEPGSDAALLTHDNLMSLLG